MRALVTGGHVRLGAAISEELARSGHDVIIHYRSNGEAARALAGRLSQDYGVECVVESADLTSEKETDALMARAIGLGCEAMVASASLFEADEASSMDEGVWSRAHMIHYAGPVRMSLALRRATERCSIVIVSDQAAMGPTEDHFSYGMSKRAMLAALPSLALCVAPGRANIVAPGFTLPTINAAESDFEIARDQTILRRGSRPEDVAQAVRFLLEAPAATGQTLAIDGGQSLARKAGLGLSFASVDESRGAL